MFAMSVPNAVPTVCAWLVLLAQFTGGGAESVPAASQTPALTGPATPKPAAAPKAAEAPKPAKTDAGPAKNAKPTPAADKSSKKQKNALDPSAGNQP